jgi:hypothetical protein
LNIFEERKENYLMLKHTIESKDEGTEEVFLTPMRAIRFFCLECLGWKPSEVKVCTGKQCSLYPYRFGTNPERAGIGGKG